MKQDIPLTDFQVWFIGEIEHLALDLDAGCNQRIIQGETENYCILDVTRRNVILNVYVYLHDAGFGQAQRWHAYERVDFDSKEDLRNAVVTDMRRLLAS